MAEDKRTNEQKAKEGSKASAEQKEKRKAAVEGTAEISKKRAFALKKGHPLKQGEIESEEFNLDTEEYDIYDSDIISIAPADEKGEPKGLIQKKPDYRDVEVIPRKKKGSRPAPKPGGIRRKPTKPKDKGREA